MRTRRTMYSLPLMLIFIAQVYCEWVEISQQHYNYKKPFRPTHSHPLLASTTTKQAEFEKTTNRNRIYIKHSVPEYNWNSNTNQLFTSDVLKNSAVNLKDRDDFDDKRPQSDKNKGVLVIRRRKPENTKNKDNHEDVQNPESDQGIRKTTSGNNPDKRKPLDDYKVAIELSNLEYTNADYISNIKLPDNGPNNNLKRKNDIIVNTTPPDDNSRRPDSRRETTEPIKTHKLRPKQEFNTEGPFLKTTNMRRVNILRSTSTYRTPTQQFDDEDYQSNTPLAPSKSTDVAEMKTKVKPPTTPYKFPHIGNVKRVTNPKPSIENNKPTKVLGNNEDKFTVDSTVHDNNKAIRRVDKPFTSSERSQTTSTKIKAHKTRYDNKNIHKILTPEDVMVEEIINGDKGKKDFTVHKVASIGPIGNIQRVRNPTDLEIGKQKDNIKKSSTTLSSKLEIDTDGVVGNEESDDRFNKVYRVSHLPGTTEQVPILTTVKYKTKNIATERPEQVTQLERYSLANPYKPIRPSREPIPEFVTKDENFINGDSMDGFDTSTVNVIRFKPTEPTYEETPRPRNHPADNKSTKSQGQANKNKQQNEDPVSHKTRASAIENLIKFLKTVTEIISRNSRRGVLGKVRYLEDLRDTILANIEERLEAAFPDDDASGGRGRRARSAAAAGVRSEPRGHVEFPSSESALMTISFLTFAVFLIKLILQVIQVYKNKTMMVMPTVISAAVGRAFTQHTGN